MYSRSALDRLHVQTDLLPDCVTNWLFHVVAVVKSTDGDVRVVDPSLFPCATVSESDYLKLVDPDPDCVEHTSMNAYIKKCGKPATGTTPLGLDNDRANAIAALVATLKEPAGPPPYAMCRTAGE